MEHLKHKDRVLKHIISMPFIYSVAIWFVVLDILTEIYHRICFPLYWLELVDRKKYIKFERHKLPYLSFMEKFNCAYCSYWNWLMAYIWEIAGQTEKYWCGIKNPVEEWFVEPKHHKDFLDYWDQKAFMDKYQNYEKSQEKCKLFQ